MNDQAAEAPQQPQQQAPPQQAAEDEQLTQDFEETDVVVREKKKDEKKTPKKEDKKVEAKPKPEQKPVEKPREVNRKALFPGRTEGSKAASEGTGTRGRQSGEPGRNAGRKPRRNRNGHRRQFGEPVRAIAGRNASETRLQRQRPGTRRDRNHGGSAGESHCGDLSFERFHDAEQFAGQFRAAGGPPRAVQRGRERSGFAVGNPLPTISGCSDVVLRRTEYSRNSV